ncbi:MAG: hypothetical protein JSW64_08130 [Candidatus Zixiibacteriota bacterium]|nr:MAG: hypothetical protein JSW64_08130 [candidate division Zixibacteria bacterium]
MADEKKKEEQVLLGQEQAGSDPAPGIKGKTGSSAILERVQERAQVIPGQEAPPESCPTCAPNQGAGTEAEAFIYSLGTIETRFPTMSVEKEFAQAIKEGKTANLTDTDVLYSILKENRYLAREVCWVLTIENIETYILVPKDPQGIDQLIDAVRPREKGVDCDVVIGEKGPIAPMEMCNGLQVPIVVFDRIYSFEVPELIKAIPKPKGKEEKAFHTAAEELFYRIMQMADNAGAMDEHRALNYLAVRYPSIYELTAEMFEKDFTLAAVEVIPSRLSGLRKLVDVVLSYVNRKTDVIEKYYVRVDVMEKWPFLVSKLAPFFDR